MDKLTLSMNIAELREKANKILLGKSKDYATKDVLSNFKRVSKIVSELLRKDMSPSDIAIILVILKLDRLQNLKGKVAVNESREDSWVDVANYLMLAMCCEKEE